MRGWSKFKDKKWRRVLQLALQPVTVGTVLASAWIISEAAAINTYHYGSHCNFIIFN